MLPPHADIDEPPVGKAQDLLARNREVPFGIRLGWAAKVAVFAVAVLFIPGLEHREFVFALLVGIIPVQLWWHRILPDAKLQSVRPLHDATVAALAAMLSPSLWVPAVVVFALSANDPAYRKRPGWCYSALGLIGLSLVFVGALTKPEAWIPTLIVGAVMITLRSQTSDRVWSELGTIQRQRSQLLSTVSAVVWTADPELGTVTWVSPNLERVTGWTPEEWIGQPQADLIHPEDLDTFWIEHAELVVGREDLRVARYRHKDGRWIWLNVVSTAVLDDTGRLQLAGHYTDATDVVEHYAMISRQARSDELTGLANRHVLLQTLEERVEADEPKFALLMLDLDRFKEINDTLGHSAGDEVLKAVGDRLLRAASDQLVCRLGGDEFAILIDDPTEMPRIVHAIGQLTAEPIAIDEVTVSCQVSIGSVLVPADGRRVGDVLRRGDAAMYQAKRRGVLHVAFTQDMERHNELELELSATLSSALDSGQFEVRFQPQIELATGRVIGAEGLVRWNHPRHGIIRPSSFLHLVGLSNAHGRFSDVVIEQASSFAAAASTPEAPFSVAVNISAISLFDPDFASRVEAAVARHRLSPDQLILEITESEIMEDHATSEQVIRQLSELGVSLSIDDFGTGYSSLTRLVELPVNEIKIDQSFVAASDADGPERAVIEATIGLGKRLGLHIVAEGIEAQSQADYLSAQGCQVGQGYLFGQAVSAAEFLRSFASRIDAGAEATTDLPVDAVVTTSHGAPS